LEASDQSYQVYKIVLKDVVGFPRIESIDDVLRLRDDSSLPKFRELVFEWAKILRSGDGRYAELLRKDIKKANEDLKKIKDWARTSALTIFLALPLLLIDSIFGTPLGNILTGVSAVYELRSRKLRRENQWIMLGS